MKNKISQWLKRATSATALLAVLLSTTTANAAILFQDDDFHDILSDGLRLGSNDAGAVDTSIQFGNDVTPTENGTINWNITTNTFEFDNTIDITGGLSADGNVDFNTATQLRLREDPDPNTNATCTVVGEVIINTTASRLEICTVVGTPGTWVAPAATNADLLDGLDSLQFLRSDTSDNFTSGTLTTDAGTTLDVNGVFDASGSTQFFVRTGAATPGTCTEGELFYNSTTNVLLTCTATDTFTATGADDFESVYATDADDTLTTGGGNFTVATGGGNQLFTLGTGEFDITSTGLIDFNADSFTLDTTGAVSIDAGAASNFTTSAGALTLSATTDDVSITAGDDILFDDLQLLAPVQLTDTATAIDATYSTTGIIDALNSLTSTATGAGASNVGIEDAGAFFTGTNVEAALQELGAVSGSNAANNEVLTFYPEYPDAVLFGDGTSNNGRMDALYDATNAEHYYEWTTLQLTLQDYDVRFRFPLPADFTDVNDFTFLYRTGTATTTDNKVDVTVRNDTDNATCGSSLTNATANTWATGTITEATLETGCTGVTALNAGDIVEVIVKLYDIVGGTTFADVGVLSLGYDN